MPRSIEVILNDGESVESAVRRFVAKFQESDQSAQAEDVATKRFRELIEAKYTRGLSSAEAAEVASLEAGFEANDENFYGPVFERVRAMRRRPPIQGPRKDLTSTESKPSTKKRKAS